MYFKIKIAVIKDKNLIKMSLSCVNLKQVNTLIQKIPEAFENLLTAEEKAAYV